MSDPKLDQKWYLRAATDFMYVLVQTLCIIISAQLLVSTFIYTTRPIDEEKKCSHVSEFFLPF